MSQCLEAELRDVVNRFVDRANVGVDGSHLPNHAGSIRAFFHMGDGQLGKIERRPEHKTLHEVVFLHGEILHSVNVLNPCNIGQVFDPAKFGRILNYLGHFLVPCQVGLHEDHLPPNVAGHFLRLLSFFFIDVQTHGHQVVRCGSDGGCAADSRCTPRDNADIVRVEICVLQNEHVFPFDLWLLDIHAFSPLVS